jgi:site-specific recombinase XerD
MSASDYPPDWPMDSRGRPRSPITLPSYRRGKRPPNYGERYPGEIYEPAEILDLVAAIPRNTPIGHRDRALFSLLWRSGIRIGEALDLREADLHESTGYVRIRRGKNQKGRDALVFGAGNDPAWGWKQLRPWLNVRQEFGLGKYDPLFCVVKGETRGRKPSDSTIRTSLKRYALKAGLRGRFHLHGFRHTLAAELFRNDVPLLYIQRQLGHSSLGYTQDYLVSIGLAQVMDALSDYQPTWTPDAA